MLRLAAQRMNLNQQDEDVLTYFESQEHLACSRQAKKMACDRQINTKSMSYYNSV